MVWGRHTKGPAMLEDRLAVGLVLRQAAEPLTTRDIALQLLIERALDKSDQRLLRLMTKRVGVALRGQRENGVVRCDQGPGQSH
jgi:hypothetical protein